MDRTIFSITAPLIATDLKLSNTQIGALSGLLFSAFYAVFGIPIARIADRGARGLVISISLACWSAITMATAATHSFLQVALTRMGVAIGEAGATPASHALLSERYTTASRPSALALHSAGAPIGSALGLALGGMIAADLGWRWAFVILGAPGLLLAILVLLRIRDPLQASERADDSSGGGFRADVRELFRSRAYVWLVLGFAAGAFIVNGLLQWLPTYFVRAFGASTREVGAAFGAAYGLGAFLGMIGGGYVASRLAVRDPRWSMKLASLSYVVAAPFGVAALLSDALPIAYACTFAMSLASTVAYGPAFATIQDLAPARLRALSSAVAIFSATLLGAGLGPLAVGFVSDVVAGDPGQRLRIAMVALVALAPAPALFYWASAMSAAPTPTADRTPAR
jgi:MFS family permease